MANGAERKDTTMTIIPRRYLPWAVGSFCLLFISAICISYFGPQTRIYFDIRSISGPPWWYKAPQSLADTTVAMNPGTTLSYFGYKFEVPWVGIEKEINEGRWSTVFFESGQEIWFSDPELLKGDPRPRTTLGSDSPVSNYESLETILSMTPSGLSPIRSHRNFARNFGYWERKGELLEHSGATDILEIQTGRYKGFEISGISYNRRVSILLFDATGREFQLEISVKPGSHTNLAQSEINRVIQSFAPAPSADGWLRR
jgi:hypothetical protein